MEAPNPRPIIITLPDGSQREVPSGTTALDIATDISEGLGRAAVAAQVGGQTIDLTRPLT